MNVTVCQNRERYYASAHVGGIKQCCGPSVCLSHSQPLARNGAFYGDGYCRTLIGNPMLEVEPTSHSGRIHPPEVAKTNGAYRFAAIGAIRCFY